MNLKFKKNLLALLLVLILPAFAACDSGSKEEATDDKAKTTEENTDKDSQDNDKNDDADNSKTDAESEESSEQNAEDSENTEAEATEAELGAFKGDIPYDFALTSFQDGKTYKLSDYLGKQPIIIKFFASWCGPCRMEMPELEGIYQDYKDDGLMVFAVNLGAGDTEEDVDQIISDYLLSYPVLKDTTSDVGFQYGIRSIPVNIFVGKDGIIKKHAVGMQTKESYEENVLSILEEK